MKDQNKKINLLYLINSFDVGGAEKAMARIVSALDKEKYGITVSALKMGSGQIIPEIKGEDIEIINLEAKSKLDFRVVFKLYKLLKNENIDILWCSLFHATVLGRITGKLVKIPIIISWEHNERFYGFYRVFLNRITSFFSDTIIADSERVVSCLVNKLKISPQKIKLIPIGGLDLKDYYTVSSKKDKTKYIVGSVGNLSEQKGYSYLVKAAKIVVQRYPETEFIVAGDGPDKEKLEQLILKENLTNNFKLLGYQQNIPKVLSGVDIYVQPSLWEGLCITVIEAMASSLPIIATDVGGISESVVDGQTGFLVPPKNPKALADKISILIENSELRKKMGEKGRKIAEEKYSIDKMMTKIENLLDEIIKKKSL